VGIRDGTGNKVLHEIPCSKIDSLVAELIGPNAEKLKTSELPGLAQALLGLLFGIHETSKLRNAEIHACRHFEITSQI
jgi:hypothetical protein